MKNKKLLKGTHDFKALVKNGGYYVDKTLLISEFMDNADLVLLMPRPRRFGKTLNLSMLEHFFDVNKKDSKNLFSEFKISEKNEFCQEHQNQYPVINLTLKDVKAQTWENCFESLKTIISELHEKHDYLLESDKIKDYEKQKIEKILLKTASQTDYEHSLKDLSKYLKAHFEKDVVILVDEYDTPIISGYKASYINKSDANFYSEIINFIQTFFGAAFKGNDNLQKGLITGIMRVARESIFSDLNNLGVYTIFNFDFADKFGFTESETKKIVDYFVPNNDFSEISKWYNGYKFGKIDKIYNPWSIVSYLSKHEEGFGMFWVHSGADELITQKFVNQNNKGLRDDLKKLIRGEAIEKPIEKNFVFPNLENSSNLIWSLLLFTGYLKPIIDTDAINQNTQQLDDIYWLTSPNREITQVYKNLVKHYFDSTIRFEQSSLIEMLKYLINNKLDRFTKLFKEFVYKLSYHDFAGDNAENVYHAFVLGLLVYLQNDYQIFSNSESGEGRPDILLIPFDKTKQGIIIELKKVAKDASETEINSKTKAAFKQISDRYYAEKIVQQGIEKRIEIVMVFAGKRVFIQHKYM